MEIRRFETPGLAHFAYLIADAGLAAVVDPRRDVDEYLEAARELGARIAFVIETHRQEDFVMGSAHLADRTGAQVVNGRHELFGRGDLRLADGEAFELGRLRVVARHTPGHTPESMSYALFDPRDPDQAFCVFTGDALFYGDTGRTDLPAADRATENAALLHDMVHQRIAPFGDAALILPAHGAGSVCGRGMAARPVSTIGAEKQYNEVFVLGRDEFARAKGEERIPRPPYFRHMERVNLRGGLAPVRRAGEVPLLSPDELSIATETGIVVDTRDPEGYAGGHIPGAYAIWLEGLPAFGGWIASERSTIYLCTGRDHQVDEAALALSRIGIDGVHGALRGGFPTWRASGRPIETSGIITPRQLAERLRDFSVVDVREPDEFAAAHIAGARQVYVGDLEKKLPDLDLGRATPVALVCGVGRRAGLAASILRRAGYGDVRNLLGGMSAWRALGLATEAS